MKLVLASTSPRRAELLRAAGFSFEILPVRLDERFMPGEDPQRAVARLAEAKAMAAAGLVRTAIPEPAPDTVVIGADTTVVVGGETLGKPDNALEAQRMLRALAGRWHDVLTGICVSAAGRRLVRVEQTRVRMTALTGDEIDWYVASGEPLDKAGGYAVQGLASRFVERIEGSYSNVVGLPMFSLYALLKELGCDILDTSNSSFRKSI